MKSLFIVMPAYNEEEVIEEVVREVHGEILARLPDSQLLVVDDGSSDLTPRILDSLAAELPAVSVHHKPNGGHGPALLSGLERAEAEWIFLMDSDRQFTPEDFWRLWEKREEKDLLIGVRASRKDPLHRLLLSRFIRASLFLLFGRRLRDANAPFKLLRRELWRELVPLIPPDTLAPSIFIAVAAAVKGKRIAEIEVRHFDRLTGQPSLKLKKLFNFCSNAFVQLLEFRRRLRAGG